MNALASRYVNIETTVSGICNGILNYAAGYAIFHSRSIIPTAGHGGMIQDSIGETFLATSLSFLIPTLIARHRRKAGILPAGDGPPLPAGNVYVRSLIVGLVFSFLLVPCAALLLPKFFPDGASVHSVLFFKVVYGTIFGALATRIALRRALNEAG